MSPFDLTNRVALVTGGNGGIGLGIARGLAKAGASIAIAARNEEKSAAATKELESLGAKVLAIKADVLKEADCRALVDRAASHFGCLDILVNNAGIAIRKPPQAYTAEEWHRVMDTNLTAAFLCSQAAYPHFKRAGGGKVISIGSIMSMQAAPFTVAYAASKGGIVQMTRAMATAWAADNIQVNAIMPGWINTALTATARREVPGLDEKVKTRTPAGRWGEPEDFEAIAVLLAGSGSQYITGAAIPVDGGYMVVA
ncbi:MAG TPA: glucose 1-dehydrogenase [Burkholderiaceae bacterium]|nr:glucose 1-dehydrogenase [Burkholderiaceae bacterium]